MMLTEDAPCVHGTPYLGGAWCQLKGHPCQASFPDVGLVQSRADCFEEQKA